MYADIVPSCRATELGDRLACLLTLAVTGGISPEKALVISLPLDGGSCSGLHARIYTQRGGDGKTHARQLDVVCRRFLMEARERPSVVTLNLG